MPSSIFSVGSYDDFKAIIKGLRGYDAIWDQLSSGQNTVLALCDRWDKYVGFTPGSSLPATFHDDFPDSLHVTSGIFPSGIGAVSNYDDFKALIKGLRGYDVMWSHSGATLVALCSRRRIRIDASLSTKPPSFDDDFPDAIPVTAV
jgi:hypothetical protein